MGKLSLTGYRSRSRHADLSTAAAFDPVTSISWAHLYYADGPSFQALGLADGASMASTNWPDEIATNAAPLTGGGGTYRAASASFNSKPCVEMPASGAGKKHTTTVAGGAQVATTFSIVFVWQMNSANTTDYFFDGANEGNSGQRVLFRSTGGFWNLFMGSSVSGGTPTTGIHAARILATSGNDTVTVDGSTVITADAGSGAATWQGISFSEAGGVEMDGRVAFWGIYSGDITAAGNWSGLVSWVSAQYGKTLS